MTRRSDSAFSIDYTMVSRREMCNISSEAEGPLFVVTSAMHGNEPATVEAVQRVVAKLQGVTLQRGRFVAYAGNVGALKVNQRFIDTDMNRGWTEEALAELVAKDQIEVTSTDDHERLVLYRLIDDLLNSHAGPVYYLDLHTTSSETVPFFFVPDFPGCIEFAKCFDLPSVTGLSAILGGTLLEFMCKRGAVGIASEGGNHENPVSADNHEALLWAALISLGIVSKEDVDGADDYLTRVGTARGDVPSVLELFYRHEITPEDKFCMKPGMLNFQPVGQGELLANDRNGEIKAERSGRILLPLYQKKGNDGFFLVSERSAEMGF